MPGMPANRRPAGAKYRMPGYRLTHDMTSRPSSRPLWGLMWLERLWQDLRYGCRMLVASPGFSSVAVVSLAIGIGANCAIFSFADALLLRPLPVAAARARSLLSAPPRPSSRSAPAPSFPPIRTTSTSAIAATASTAWRRSPTSTAGFATDPSGHAEAQDGHARQRQPLYR